MPTITPDDIRIIVREETKHLATKSDVDGLTKRVDTLATSVDTLETRVDGLTTRVDGLATSVDALGVRITDVESTLNDKMDIMLSKMDGFIDGLEKEKQERTLADHQLERRVETLERSTR